MTDPFQQPQPSQQPPGPGQPGAYGQGYPGPYGYGHPGPYGPPPGPPPENNLVWGILTTVMCCLPLGIVSIVKASEVNKYWFTGQYDAAYKAASDAGKWAMWSAISAVIFILGSFIFYFVVIAAAFTSLL